MSVFLYTYCRQENYVVSRQLSVFGAPANGGDGLAGKVRRLRPGDHVLIRDASRSDVVFLGCGRVLTPVFHQRRESPFKDHLWPDEQARRDVLYHLRAVVDFRNGPTIGCPTVTFGQLIALGFINRRGMPLDSEQAWGMKLRGNFLETRAEIEALSTLL